MGQQTWYDARVQLQGAPVSASYHHILLTVDLVYCISYAGFRGPAAKREGSDDCQGVAGQGGGVDSDELHWISLIDDQRITLNGTQPIKVAIKKSTRTPKAGLIIPGPVNNMLFNIRSRGDIYSLGCYQLIIFL